jgi:hypothetical protein
MYGYQKGGYTRDSTIQYAAALLTVRMLGPTQGRKRQKGDFAVADLHILLEPQGKKPIGDPQGVACMLKHHRC